ncbi:hypothetical protein [Lactobacillus bombicola]|uniref:hypothetical protein n=1 Tax=Lactobacillus bombicola TaxID=1505723 RepID=UPI000E56C62F|nr:hypothetical protein [Lactobacillus bombicola]RHW48688.1 hypothetical protein DS833_07525 [Lactobacillus bombicola]
MSLISVIYGKDNPDKILFTGTTDTEVDITGLPAGTQVQTGDYLVAIEDTDKHLVSDKVPVPAFTVPAKNPDAPRQVNVEATNDGAKVNLE